MRDTYSREELRSGLYGDSPHSIILHPTLIGINARLHKGERKTITHIQYPRVELTVPVVRDVAHGMCTSVLIGPGYLFTGPHLHTGALIAQNPHTDA